MFNFFHSELLSVNIVVAVKAAVDAVILTEVGYIERCKYVDRVSEMLSRFQFGSSCHALKEWSCGRGEQRFKILDCTCFVGKRTLNIFCCVFIVIICVHLRDYFFLYIRFNNFHTGQVCHMIDSR